MRFRELKLRRDPACPLCGENPRITGLIDYLQFCGIAPEPPPAPRRPEEVTVQEMQQALSDPGLGIRVIDVRDPNEYQIARVAGATLIPLSTLPERFTELNPALTYYVHCKSGQRSLQAVEFLRAHGFTRVHSVRGGIAAWSEEIDPRVPKY